MSSSRASTRRASGAAILLCTVVVVPSASGQSRTAVEYGAFIDAGLLADANDPASHLFRSRGTTPRVDELDVNMLAFHIRQPRSAASRWMLELTAQTGEDSKTFGFSSTAPIMGGADVLRHLGPTSVAYVAPVAKGLTIQGGIFNSLIGYDALYAKDNFNYTRPWGADYTPYLMLGVNAAYPATPRLTVTGILINGYWHLANANSVPTSGAQLAFKPNDTVTVKETVLYGPHQNDTSLGFWRVLSDTILERKTSRVTTAFEYQVSTERVDDAIASRAYWMSAQLPIHWSLAGPFSATVRPEIAWDSDGRWTGFPQAIKAVTGTLEYRVPLQTTQAIVRTEYRLDDSRGSGGGFFAGADNHLSPTQNLFAIALILTFDGTFHR